MDNINEEWRDIKGFEGLYQVSNLGRVKNAKGLIKKPTMNNRGYIRLSLWEGGKSKNFSVHRLVAEAFIPNPDNKPCVGQCNISRCCNGGFSYKGKWHPISQAYGFIWKKASNQQELAQTEHL